MQGMAEYYSLNLATEVIKGRKVKIKKGEHAGGTYPFGYRPDGHGGYAIDEVEAYYVKKLYQAVLDGTRIKTITDEMRDVGIRGRRGSYLVPGNVATMLRMPIYAGIYDVKAGDEHNLIENNHPAIVSVETYTEACKIMDSRKNVGRHPKREYFCTSLITCAGCGSPMYGKTQHRGDNEFRSYVCHKLCGVRSIRMDELDQAACDYVAAILSPEVRQQLTSALSAYIDGQRKQAQRSAPNAKREIAKLEQQIDAITANMASGVLPPSVLERLSKQIVDCETQIELLRSMAAPPPEVDVSLIDQYFADAATVTLETDPALAHKILSRFIERITISNTAIEFTCTFNGWLREHFPQLSGTTIIPTPDSSPDNDPPSDSPDSKSHTPASRKKRFVNLQILFETTVVKRMPTNIRSGCVARRLLDMFERSAQNPD